jgi:hypothetical protein
MYLNVLKRDFSQLREHDSYLGNSARTSLCAQFPSKWKATPTFPGFPLNLVSTNYIHFRWLSVQDKQTPEKRRRHNSSPTVTKKHFSAHGSTGGWIYAKR